jgi:protein TonB
MANAQEAPLPIEAPCKDATFKGGQTAMNKFFKENLHFPDSLFDVQGKVYVGFEVDTSGAIRNVKLKRGIHPVLDMEALRLVRLMPTWEPMVCDGKKEKVRMVVPLQFKAQ